MFFDFDQLLSQFNSPPILLLVATALLSSVLLNGIRSRRLRRELGKILAVGFGLGVCYLLFMR